MTATISAYSLALTDKDEAYGSLKVNKNRTFSRAYVIGGALVAITLMLTILSLPGQERTIDAMNAERPNPVLAYLPKGASFPFFYGSRSTGRTLPLNSTLGFGKIYVLNLPARTDKRAEMTILAAQHGLSIDFVDGIDGRKAHPELNPDQQGKWGVAEGHTKIWQNFLQSGLSTALIFEDDVDFDVRIKDQLRLLQEPLATYFSIMRGEGTPLQITVEDPWMHTEWDHLWLGNCKDAPQYIPGYKYKVEYPIPFLIYEDQSVTGLSGDRRYVKETFDAFGIHRRNDSSQNVRMIKKPYEVYCFQSYAITVSGAKKMLYNYAHTRNDV